jgi:hypothetical protein
MAAFSTNCFTLCIDKADQDISDKYKKGCPILLFSVNVKDMKGRVSLAALKNLIL